MVAAAGGGVGGAGVGAADGGAVVPVGVADGSVSPWTVAVALGAAVVEVSDGLTDTTLPPGVLDG